MENTFAQVIESMKFDSQEEFYSVEDLPSYLHDKIYNTSIDLGCESVYELIMECPSSFVVVYYIVDFFQIIANDGLLSVFYNCERRDVSFILVALKILKQDAYNKFNDAVKIFESSGYKLQIGNNLVSLYPNVSFQKDLDLDIIKKINIIESELENDFTIRDLLASYIEVNKNDFIKK